MNKIERLEWLIIALIVCDIIDVGCRLLERFF